MRLPDRHRLRRCRRISAPGNDAPALSLSVVRYVSYAPPSDASGGSGDSASSVERQSLRFCVVTFGLPGEFRVRYCRDGVTAAVTLYRTTKPLTKYPPLAVVRGFAKQAGLSRPILVETLKRPAQDRQPKPARIIVLGLPAEQPSPKALSVEGAP